MKPWEQPRIQMVIDIFGAHVVEIKHITFRRDTSNGEEIRR